MKILIVRFSAIGDILLTFPVVEALGKKYANAEIHFLTKPAHASLLQLLPRKIKVHLLSDSLLHTARALREEHFDLVIDLHNNLRTLILQVFMRSFHWKRVNKLNIRKWLLTTFKWDTLPNTHVIDRYAKAANVKVDFPVPLNHSSHQHPFPLPTSYVAWVLGATFETKQFPLNKIKEVLPALNCPVVLLGGTKELEMANELLKAFPSVLSLVGKTSISEAALVLKEAKLVVTNDTGLMHLASFYNKPMVCLWGNTLPAFGMYPFNNDQIKHFEVKDLACRPCSKIGSHRCPKSHFNCMQQQDSTAISTEINALFLQ